MQIAIAGYGVVVRALDDCEIMFSPREDRFPPKPQEGGGAPLLQSLAAYNASLRDDH